MRSSFFEEVIVAIGVCSGVLVSYYTLKEIVFLYIFDMASLLSIGYVIYHFRGWLCKERVKSTGKTICARCKGFYFGFLLSIAIALMLVYSGGVPCFSFVESIILIILALFAGVPTMIQGYTRRASGEMKESHLVTIFGFLVGIATTLAFVAFNSLFGCSI